MKGNRVCRKTEDSDIITYFVLDSSAKVLQNVAQMEQSKPDNNRNPLLEVVLGLGILGCALAKFYVNRNLCNPINIL